MEDENNEETETSKLLTPLDIYEECDESEIGHFVNEDTSLGFQDNNINKKWIPYNNKLDGFNGPRYAKRFLMS